MRFFVVSADNPAAMTYVPDKPAVISTHDKALRINLDPVRYGAFAEIGAGQEVARWFF